jgi:hypothetical protein
VRTPSDLLWDEVRGFLDPDVIGALPDVCVPGTSVADWQSVLDLVTESGWAHEYSESGTALPMPMPMPMPMPRAGTALSRTVDAELPELRVRPTADVLAIFRFHSEAAIDFDVDLRERQGQERLDVLCGFLRAIGRRLGRPVLMDTEGGDGRHPVLGYDVAADRVVLSPEPWTG